MLWELFMGFKPFGLSVLPGLRVLRFQVGGFPHVTLTPKIRSCHYHRADSGGHGCQSPLIDY